MQTILVCLLYTAGVFAQSGTLKGKVIDKSTKDPIPFASVVLEKGGKSITGTAADIAGEFTIKPIPPGTYDLKATNVGYNTVLITNIVITADTITYQELVLEAKTTTLCTVQIVSYKVPLISKDQTTCGNTITSSSYNSGGIFGKNKKNKSKDPVEGNTESYDKIVENEFHKVVNNPLSTFSIDVDDASYSNMRRYITQGTKPPIDAIRTEELINYFDYNYPSPTGDEPFAIYSEVSGCPWNTKHQLVRIGIQGKQIDTSKLPNSNIVLLLDVSGSMADNNKLSLVKKAMHLLVNQMHNNDKIAIVIYATTSSVLLNSTSCMNKSTILNAIDGLVADGSTAGADGIKKAYDIAKENFIANGNNRVIIATDGDFNVGMSSDADIENLIISRRNEGIFLSVLGVGMGNYKDSKMEKLADKGNGNYSYIDNFMEARKVLVKELGATMYTIAKDVKIQVEFNPLNVKAYRLIGYEDRMLDDKDFNDDTKDAGELGAGSNVTAVYEIITSESELKNLPSTDKLKYQKNKVVYNPTATNEMMTIKVRYKNPKESQSLYTSSIVYNNNAAYSTTSENFKFTLAVIEFSMLLRDSKFKGNTTYSEILKLANEGKGEDKDGYRSEFIKLVELASLLK